MLEFDARSHIEDALEALGEGLGPTEVSINGVPPKPGFGRASGWYRTGDVCAMFELQNSVPLDDEIETLIDKRS